ncbi:DUF4238 domain-containing protein [Mesorhizobium sp. M0152]|uniref:DUF4238 domain-containing protein n=1 Tax=unclassified Mesorhizobium TaxID=325217 RepID=UPI003339AB63
MGNHHFVPKFILKRFVGEHGRLCAYALSNGARSYVPVTKAACSENFYDFEISGRNISYEGRLSKLESNCARSIKKMVDHENVLSISEQEREIVSLLIAIQSFRTASFFEGASAVDKERRANIFMTSMRSSFLIQKEILGRKWVLMKIEGSHTFYVGDHPVTFQNTENPSQSGDLGFDVAGIEAFFPLTPKLALYIPHQSTSRQLTDGYASAQQFQIEANRAVLSGQYHPMANPEGLSSIRKTLISGKIFDDAFHRGTPMPAVEENVINFNYLQILFAHKNVFSCKDDFSFADYVLEKSPQYRQVPKVFFSTYSPGAE